MHFFDPVEHLRKPGHDRRLAELRDIGARKEGLSFAGDHDSIDRIVRLGLLDRSDQPLPNRRAECVHRRIVGQDDQHVAVALRRDRVGGGGLGVENVGHVAAPCTVGLMIERWRCRQAAVDDDGLSVDVAQFVGGEEKRRPGDLDRFAAALQVD